MQNNIVAKVLLQVKIFREKNINCEKSFIFDLHTYKNQKEFEMVINVYSKNFEFLGIDVYYLLLSF